MSISSTNESIPVYSDPIYLQFLELDTLQSKIDFFAEHVTQEGWICQHPKLCKKVVKHLVENLESDSKQLDVAISKVIVVLGGHENLKFYKKILPAVSSKSLKEAHAAILQQKILNQDSSSTRPSPDEEKLFHLATELDSTDLLIWLKKERPTTFQLLTNPKEIGFPRFLRAAARHSALTVLEWISEEIPETKKICIDVRPSWRFDSETFVHEAAMSGQLKVLKWFAAKYPEQFELILGELFGASLLRSAAHGSSLTIFEWLHESYSKWTTAIFSNPIYDIPILVTGSKPIFDWILIHYPSSIKESLKFVDYRSNLLHRVDLELLKVLYKEFPDEFKQELNSKSGKAIVQKALKEVNTATLDWLQKIDQPLLESHLRKDNPVHIALDSRGSFEWLLVNYPELSEQCFVTPPYHSSFIEAVVLRERSNLAILYKHRSQYVLGHLEDLGQAFRQHTSLADIQETLKLFSYSTEAEKIRLEYKVLLPWMRSSWYHKHEEVLEIFKRFMQSPHLTTADFSLFGANFGVNIVQHAAEKDDVELLSFIYKYQPKFFEIEADRRDHPSSLCLLHHLATRYTTASIEWLCQTLPEYVNERLDTQLAFHDPMTTLEQVYQLFPSLRDNFLEIFSRYCPQVIEFHNLLTEAKRDTKQTALLIRILLHPRFTISFLKSLDASKSTLFEPLLQQLCRLSPHFDSYDEEMKKEIASYFAKPSGSGMQYFRLSQYLKQNPDLSILKCINQHTPSWFTKEVKEALFKKAIDQESVEILEWLENEYTSFIQEQFALDTPSRIKVSVSGRIWKWAIDKAPHLALDLDKHIDYFMRYGGVCADLIQVFAPRIDEERLAAWIQSAHASHNKNCNHLKALEVLKLLPLKFSDEKNRLMVVSDLALFAKNLGQMRSDPNSLLNDNSSQNQVEERLKEIFAPENIAYLEYALPKLLVDREIAHYLINTRSAAVAKVISVKELPLDLKIKFLPLLAPSDMVEVMDTFSEDQLQALLQKEISVPQLIEGDVSVKKAIELCHTNWNSQVHTSQDIASTYAQMTCSLLRAMPFKTLVAATRSQELQDKMIASLPAMSPEQQAVVIPQLENKKLSDYLKKLSITSQAAILGMATRAQKISYLESMEKSFFSNGIAVKWIEERDALEREIEAFAKRPKSDPKNKELFQTLQMKISNRIFALTHMINSEKLTLNQLTTKLSEPKEISEALLHLIETKPKAIFADFVDSLGRKNLEIALEKIAEEFGLKEEETPPEFICPISQEVMEDPVEASDKKVYDRTSIEEWMKTNLTSPITREVLTNVLKPQSDRKEQILEWKQKQNSTSLSTEKTM